MASNLLQRYEVSPLDEGIPFGATVKGLSLEHLADERIQKSLRDLWVDRGVLLFRDGDHTSAMHVELSKCFGPLQRFPFKENWVDGHPELLDIKYRPEDGNCYRIDGELIGGYLPWHTDGVYTDTLSRGGILTPVQLPKRGGLTGLIDKIAAYERLPDSLKTQIDSMHVVYVMDLNSANQKFGRRGDVQFVRGAKSFNAITHRQYQYPRILHPMVITQAETGRKVLNVSPWFADGIYEMGGPEGDALLADVVERCTDQSNAYFHTWRAGDMLLWDNWRTLHTAPGVPADETRVMRRTTIAGNYALGRKLDGGEDLPRVEV